MESIEQHLEQTVLGTAAPARNVHRWQKDLLPLMTRMLIALTSFFFVASCVQLIYLHRTIQNGPKVDTRDALSQLVVGVQPTPEQILGTTRLRAIVTLEASSVEHQYHQAAVGVNVALVDHVSWFCHRYDPCAHRCCFYSWKTRCTPF